MGSNEINPQPKEPSLDTIVISDTTDFAPIEGADVEPEDYNLGVEIAKSLTLSAAQTAGVVGGFITVAIAWDASSKLYKRYFKKEKPEVPVITDLPETPEKS